MPQVFKIGSYVIFIWYAESNPLEPIHVYVCEGVPSENATKIWITKEGRCSLANNNSKIPSVVLNKFMRVIEARAFEIIKKALVLLPAAVCVVCWLTGNLLLGILSVIAVGLFYFFYIKYKRS